MGEDRAESPGQPASETTAAAGGEFSALLLEIAAAPEEELAEAFERGLRPGDVVGRFEILREIGRGGFGVVHEARDRDLGRLVAFKAIRPGGRAASRLREEQLLREAETAARLSHPNIVVLYDYGRWPGGPYLVLERLRGRTLADRLRQGRLPPAEALAVATGVTRALVHAHAAHVLHRDLKPGNVFLCDDGSVKVLDFGLAHLFGSGSPTAGGTPAYMAPEQWAGEPEDARADLFSLGVLLYEMLAGRHPHPARRKAAASLPSGPPPPLAVRGVPRRLAALVSRCLAPERARRPAAAGEVLAELRAVERGIPGRTLRRSAALGAALAALAAVGFAVFRGGADPPAGERVPVSVADFDNETGEPDLDGLSGLLATSLEQSRRLSVVTRSSMIDVLRGLGRDGAARIDEPLAREAGRAAGVRALLLGTVRRFREVYSLELRALDPVRDLPLFALREQAEGKSGIPAVVDRISELTRERLQERPGEIRRSSIKVAEAVTRDLEAHRHYFLGLDCLDRPSRHPGQPESCLAAFRKAVAIDPGFALAHHQLSRALVNEHTPTEADRAASATALKLSERAPPKERTLIQAWAARLAGRPAEALRLYGEVIAAFPREKQALYQAGDVAFHEDDQATSAEHMARVLALDPTSEFALDHLSYGLAVLGRREELAARVRAWTSMAPTPALLRALVQAHIGLGDAAAAVAAARRERDAGPAQYAVPDLARALAFAGDYPALEEELRRAPEPSPIWLAHAVAAQGRRAEAVAGLDALLRRAGAGRDQLDLRFVRALLLAGDGRAERVWADARALRSADAHHAGWLAVHLARLGDAERARELAAGLAAGSEGHELWLAAAEWKAGRGAEARARLRALEVRNPVPRAAMAPAFLRGEIASDEGLDAEAVEALRSWLGLYPLGAWRSWAYPRSLFLLARSLERLGQRDEARAEVDRLLRLWSRADEGIPMLAEARAMRARLASPGPAEAPGPVSDPK